MDPSGSIYMYPRVDDKFKKKHSYNYDMMKANIMKKRQDKGLR